jgi:Na+/H+-dicarboxylate symporter
MASRAAAPPAHGVRPKLGLSSRILIGLALGALAGLFLGEPVAALEPVADIYIRLMQMMVLPYLVLTLVLGIGQLDVREARRLALRAGALVVASCVLALLVVRAMPFAFPTLESASFFSNALLEPAQPFSLAELYVPANPFNALANAVVPAVVLFSTALGVALIGIPGKESLLANLRVLEQAVVKVTGFVIALTPIGVFAIVAVAAGTMDPATLQRLEVYLAAFAVAAILLTFVAIPLAVTAVTPFRYVEVVTVARDALLTAFIASSAFIVLPILVERAKQLIARHGLASADSEATAEIVAPIAFTFPNAGKLLTLLFVPYVAWLTGDPLGAGSYATLFGAGVPAYFAKAQVALPFLMDLVGVPHDYFQLYIPTTIVTGKFDSLATAMSLLAMSLVGAAAMGGFVRIEPIRLLVAFVAIVAAVAAAVAGTRMLLAATVDTTYRKDQLVREMHLPRGPIPAVVRAEVPPPDTAAGPAIERIRARGALRVGFVPERVPFTFENARGELVGFDVELASLIARDLGVPGLEFVPSTWAALPQLLVERRVDLLMSVPYTTELLPRIRYSAPYFDGVIGFVVRDGRRHDFATLEAIRRLGRVTLAIQAELPSIEERVREQLRGTDVRFRVVSSPAEFHAAGTAAGIDAMVMLAEAGSAWTLLHPEYSVVVPRPTPLRWPVAIATRNADDDLAQVVNEWLVIQKSSGEIGRAYDYWMLGKGAEPARRRWTIMRDVLGWNP